MSEASVVTSENSAEFYAQKLGLAQDTPKVEAEKFEEPVSEPTEEPVAESEPQAEPVKEQQDKKPNPKLEKRFSELSKQRDLARQEAERERQAREDLERRLKEVEQKINPAPVVDVDAEPKPEMFKDAYEYAKALAEYSAEKALKERDRQEQERQAQEARQKVLDSWTKKLEEAKQELQDFDEMVASSDVTVSDQVRDAILESDVGPKILYHLAENPEIATKINAMSVTGALREIGKLEARFERKEEPATKTVANISKAPPPINPLKGVGAVPDVSDTDKMDYKQWKEMRRAGKIR
ncbi:MAG TPA: hypothetical protein PL140_09165 [Ferrovaceae bacterium]|nr:hypothetical protein [Ferrovaceae bacterium]